MFTIDEIIRFTERFKSLNILVIGESFLDCYNQCIVKHVSSGVAVPVLNSIQKDYFLGGTANIAANLGSFVQKCGIITNIGRDNNATLFRELLEKHNIIPIGDFSTQYTNVNERVCVSEQQIIRYDGSHPHELSDIYICTLFENNIEQYDGVILADYGHDFLQPETWKKLISIAKKHKKKTFVTSRQLNWKLFNQADYLIVNADEMVALRLSYSITVNDDASESVLLKKTKCKGILNTLGSQGMRYYSNEIATGFVQSRAFSTPYINPSGAGDTVMALFVLFAISFESFLAEQNLIDFLNFAGFCAVKDKYTFVINALMLIDNYYDYISKKETASKIVSSKAASLIINSWKISGQSIVFTNGCFDLFHYGHLKNLEFASQQGQKLIVSVNSDQSVKNIKGHSHPVITEFERASIIAALHFVDMVIINPDDTASELITSIKPDVYVKGAEYLNGFLPESNFADKTVFVPMIPTKSTTSIISKIINMEKNNE